MEVNKCTYEQVNFVGDLEALAFEEWPPFFLLINNCRQRFVHIALGIHFPVANDSNERKLFLFQTRTQDKLRNTPSDYMNFVTSLIFFVLCSFHPLIYDFSI